MPSDEQMIRAAVKEGTFLHSFLQFTHNTETPYVYDFWTGLWLIAMAAGREMVVARPAAPVHLNLYVVLTADAGTTRKSSAIRRVSQVLHCTAFRHEYAYVSGSATPTAFIKDIAAQAAANNPRGDAQVAIQVSELVTMLGRETHSMGMPGLLTDLYDCPAVHRHSRSEESFTLQNVYVCFLAASTPAWLVRAINPDVIEGGFTSRCLFIQATKPKRLIAWPEAQNEVAFAEMLGKQLQLLHEQCQKWKGRGIELSPQAKTRFVKWYEGRAGDEETHDPFIQSFEAREDHHILRLAALLCINEQSYVILPQHIIHAVRIIASVKASASSMFGGGRHNHKLVIGIDKLRDELLRYGEHPTPRSDLYLKVRNYMSAAECRITLQTMHELGMVQRFEHNNGGRTGEHYRATRNLFDRKLRSKVQEVLLHR
jgi:hypothetical protein